MNYTPYHIHTEDSLLDSCTNYKLYIDKAAEFGQTAIAFTEHGNIYNWVSKYLYCREKGIKYLHGTEIYLTETLDKKIRDNYHTILIAKNKEGFKEINKLIKISTSESHIYYKPRLTFDEFFNISDNVIKISACLQSPLWGMYNDILSKNENQEDREQVFMRLLDTYDYYEIQYHNQPDQIEFNKFLYKMAQAYGKPLIVGTDTHSLNSYKAECRTILQYGKTDGVWGDSENKCDLTYKSYDELIEMFTTQNSLPMDVITQALENTNVMADSCEELEFDTHNKYPFLYGERDEEVLWETLHRKYDEKVARGEIDDSLHDEYWNQINEEMRVFKKTDMIGFMLFMSEIVSWAKDEGIAVGFARGSCAGSTVAYISDTTDVDPIKWKTIFSRFANENRVEAGDIDTDWYEDDRPRVYDYIIDRFGKDKTAYVLAVGTLADKAVIDVIGKAYRVKTNGATPYTLDKIAEIKKEYDSNPDKAKEQYSDLFYYYDGLVGCVVSQSQHPAGIIVSPLTLEDNFSTFYGKEGQLILPLDMDECHEMGLIKFDILGLKSVGVIDKTCRLLGSSFPKAYQVNWTDQDVYDDMTKDHTTIFQFESDFAGKSLKTMACKSVFDLSLVNACIRPSGESYRDKLLNKIPNKNPSELIDKLLENNYGYLIYQEDIIAFLQQICGLSGSEADSVRRAIGRKKVDELNKALPKIFEGYCNKSDKPREVAEEEAKVFLKVIEDASGYSFGYNHSIAYSMLSYMCGYLRYYYPTEFCTSFLNCAKNDDDILNGTVLARAKGCTIKKPKFRFSTGEYGCDPSTSTIYKGLSSIKYISGQTGEELYTLKDNVYPTFVDLLKDIKEKPNVNSKQLDILVKVGFFEEEFGHINNLLYQIGVYEKFGKSKVISKDKLNDYELSVISKYAQKETAKQFRDISNLEEMIKALISGAIIPKTTQLEKAAYEVGYLGFTDIIDSTTESNIYIVTSADVNKYGTPFVSLYNPRNGHIGIYKCNKDIYKETPCEPGDILRIILRERKKGHYDENKNWIRDDETEEYIKDYSILKRI